MSLWRMGIGMSDELAAELNAIVAQLSECRDTLDSLCCHAAAADANQAIERLLSFMRGAHAAYDSSSSRTDS